MIRMDAYQKLLQRSRECALIQSACSILHWDHQTYMPPRAADYRGEQTACLSSLAHRLFTAKEVGKWLAECESGPALGDSVEKCNLREWHRRHNRAVRIPDKLVMEMERTTSAAHETWLKARQTHDFSVFQPHLKRIVELRVQMAELWGYVESPYDALLDEYEPGMRSSSLKVLFDSLAPGIAQLVAAGVEHFQQTPAVLPPGPYPIEQQKLFNQVVAAKIGFDFQAGRIDTAAHPFCSGVGPNDCRLTTRYHESDFTSSLYGILHEAGHGLYEQGLPAECHGTPAGEAVSLGIHESQSRFWENHIGRSPLFWEHWFPVAREFFPQLASSSADELTRYVNRVEKSFIRVEADEVTYDLHIILRFEIEQRLIEGELRVDEVPEYWNCRFENWFGLEVPDDTMGCLQDIHWSAGLLGYFPTYALGNMYAAQLFNAAERDLGSLNGLSAKGNFKPLKNWLNEKIHRHGKRYPAKQLVQVVTGETLSHAPLIAHLRSKYSELYGL